MQRMDERLYVVTRADLDVGLAAAQCTHAALMFVRDRWEEAAPWFRDSNWLVLVTVPDEQALIDLCHRASMRRLAPVTWHEPDMGSQLTAAALPPGSLARVLCANLPLLGRSVRIEPEMARAG